MASNKRYDVFHRTWWKKNAGWPRGLEPQAGERHYLAHDVDYSTALEMCEDYNSSHDPGELSNKAEFDEA